jgi:hypothetical protein
MSGSGYWLESNSPEHDYVRYNLTSSTAHLGIIEKLNIWKINNTELQYRYERRTNGMLKVQGWYDAEDLDSENSLEQICIRGFHVDPSVAKGMEFSTGIIHFDDETYASLDHCFLLLEIAIGRSFVYDGNLSEASLPHGYDSLYLPEKPLDRNKDGKFSLQEYQNAATFDHRNSGEYNHRYFVTDIHQVIPKYIVRFRLANPKLANNIFETMTNQIVHNNRNIQNLSFIDPITLLPPEADGNNPAGQQQGPSATTSSMANFDKKKYIPIEKLYLQATEEINYAENESSFLSKNKWITRQLSNIEEKVREINLNYVDILDSIDHSVEETKKKLQFFIREKLELCLSIEIELRRQLEQMDWYNNIISYELKKYQHYIVECGHQNDMLKKFFMLEFLKLWKQHSLLSNSLNRLKPNELAIISNIHGDVKVNTNIQLYVDPFYAAHQAQTTGAAATTTAINNQDTGKKTFQNLPNASNEGNYHQPYLPSFAQRAVSNEFFNNSNMNNATITGIHHHNRAEGQNSNKIFHASPIQSIMEEEMETIQDFISKETHNSYSGLRLPLSISRPFLSGNTFNIYQQNNPSIPLDNAINSNNSGGLTMHSLIENLKASSFSSAAALAAGDKSSNRKLIQSLGTESMENISTIGDLEDSQLRKSFAENMPSLLGHSGGGGGGGVENDVTTGVNNLTVNTAATNANARTSPPNSPLSRSKSIAQKGTANKSATAKKGGGGGGAADAVVNPFQPPPLNNLTIRKDSLSSQSNNNNMTVEQVKQYLHLYYPNYRQYSLSELSAKKQKQLQVKFLLNEAKSQNSNELTNVLNALKKSKLLMENEQEILFYSLPFFNKLPILTCIYSTIEHRRDLEELYSKTTRVRAIF